MLLNYMLAVFSLYEMVHDFDEELQKINYSFIIVRETDLFCMNTYFLTHNIMTTGKRVKANKHDLTKERIRGSFSLLSLNLILYYSKISKKYI